MTGAEHSGSTVASMLLGTYKVTPSLAPLARVAVVANQEPGDELGGGAAFVNPILGITYGRKIGGTLRFSSFLGATLPIGMGGGEKRGTDETAAAAYRGIACRSAMDNAMFAVNYFSLIGGADLAYVNHNLTVQVEATVLQLFRARNEDVDGDDARTNSTFGLHVGYFVLPMLSLSAELRYQRWLSTPAVVAANPAARDTATFAIGPRFHFKLNGTTWIRPGLSYSRAIDAPLSDGEYNILQLDVPVAF
jgi:hypothetical protein